MCLLWHTESMNTIVLKLKKVLRLLVALIPTPIPVGVSNFESWAEQISEMSGLPKDPSHIFVLAAMVTNLKKDTSYYIPKLFFVLMLKNAAARQIAGHVMYESKRKQKEADEAIKKASVEKTLLEATGGPQQQGI